LEIGSDIGGSIRVPAHYCGVFGHKPTWALLPNYGDPATSAAAPTDIAVIGPLARSAADLATMLDLLTAPDPAETGLTIALPAPRAANLRDLRFAVWAEQPGQATDADTTTALHELATFLGRSGATVSLTARPSFDATEAFHLYLRLLDAAWSARNSEELLNLKRHAKANLPPGDTSADAIMARSVDMPHRVWLGLNEQRHKFRRTWTAFFQDWDVLLMPTIAGAALPHMQDGPTWERHARIDGRDIPYNDLLFWPGLPAGCHLPSTIAPLGMTQGGLPLGVQIVGPIHGDRTTIAVAGLLEQAWLAFKPPPGMVG